MSENKSLSRLTDQAIEKFNRTLIHGDKVLVPIGTMQEMAKTVKKLTAVTNGLVEFAEEHSKIHPYLVNDCNCCNLLQKIDLIAGE